MALRGDRDIRITEIGLSCSDVVEAGQILVYGTAGSGNGLGDVAGTATLKAGSPSGFKPAGLALSNVVNVDQTRFHRNFHKTDQVVGERVNLLRQGWVVTNNASGTPTPGADAYLGNNGGVQPTLVNLVATPYVGEFMTGLDQDGYVKLAVKLA